MTRGRAFMAGSDSQTVGIVSSQAPGLTSCFEVSMDVNHDTGDRAAVTVYQFASILYMVIDNLQ